MDTDYGTRLDPAQESNLWECFYAIAQLQKAAKTFVNMIADCVPVITAPALGGESLFDEDFEFVYRNSWARWICDVYIYLYVFGICPWRMVKLSKGSSHYVPEVLPYGAGYIKTMLEKDGRQKFNFFMNATPTAKGIIAVVKETPEKNVYFATNGAAPNLDGTFRSPLMALLPDYIYMKLVRRNLKVVIERQGHPESIIEYNPPRNVTGDDDLQLLAKWPEEIVGAVVRSRHGLKAEKMRLHKRDVERSVAETRRKNERLGNLINMGTAEDYLDQLDRKTANQVAFAYQLPAYTSFKPIAPPQINVDLIKLQERLSQQALAIMEIPSSMFDGKGGSNKSSIATVNEVKMVNEGIKYWKNYFETLILKALLVQHKDYLYKKFADIQRRRGAMTDGKLVELVAEVDIKVELPCAAYTNLPTLFELYQRKIIAPDKLMHYVSETTGIPEDHLIKPPVPPNPFEEMVKKTARPREAKPKVESVEKQGAEKRRKIEKELS